MYSEERQVCQRRCAGAGAGAAAATAAAAGTHDRIVRRLVGDASQVAQAGVRLAQLRDRQPVAVKSSKAYATQQQ